MTCLAVGATLLALAGPAFSLEWTHSVEKTAWHEAWRVEGRTLVLDEARVKGSGAGMEPGEGARRRDGWWVWSPGTRVERLSLAASGATGGGWTLCSGGRCMALGAEAGTAVVIAPCAP